MRNYSTSLEGKIEILGHEGIALKPYLDSVGVKTVGGGSTVSDVPDLPSWPWTREITMSEVIAYFEKGLKKYEDGINKALNVNISQQQFDALVSFAYNVGWSGAAKSTAMRRLNAGESKARVGQALMMWTKPKEIAARRNKERLLFETGEYQNGGKALLFPVSSTSHKPIYSQGKQIDVKKYLTAGEVPVEEVSLGYEIKLAEEPLDKPEVDNINSNKSKSTLELFIDLIRAAFGGNK